MFRRNARTRYEARAHSQNIRASDIMDFPTTPVDGEFIMYDLTSGKYVTSGKDAVSTAEMNAAITNLIDGAPGTLNTLKEIADTLGDPDNIATDLISKVNATAVKTDLISFDPNTPRSVNLNQILGIDIKDFEITRNKIAAGEITTSKIADRNIGELQIAINSITTNHIAAQQVTTNKIADLAINQNKLATGSVTSLKIGQSQVINNHLASNSVQENNILNDSITTSKILNQNITTSKLKDGDVTSIKLAQQCVNTTNLANDCVTNAKMADNAVQSENILNQSITSAKMATSSITAINITDGNVTTSKFAAGAVDSNALGTSSVTRNKIANLEVVTDKLAYHAVTEDQIAVNAVTNNKIKNDEISLSKMKADSIGTNQLIDNSVTSAKIANNTIVVGDLANDCVTTDKILDSNITAVKLASNSVETAKIKNRNVTSEKIAENAITKFELASNAIETTHLKALNVTTSKIADKNITFSKIQDVAPNTIVARNDNDTGVLSSVTILDKQLLIGTGNGFNARELSGDVTMNNLGEVTVSADAITTSKIGAQQVTKDKIKAKDITHAEIATKTITGGSSGNIAFNTIISENILADEIKQSNVGPGAIGTTELEDRKVTSIKIDNGAVTSNELGINAVETTHIKDLNVTHAKLAADSVISSKILNGNITTAKIADSAIVSAKIADNNVILSKIQKIDGNALLVNNTGASDNVVAKVVSNKQLLIGNGAGFNSRILTGDITMDNEGVVTVSNNAINNSKIATNSIDINQLQANSVGSTQLVIASVSGGATGIIALDTITTDNLAANSVDSSEIKNDAVITSKILAGNVTLDKLDAPISHKLSVIDVQGLTTENPLVLNNITSNSTNITNNTIAITALTTGAPELLNTLSEIASALGNDANYATSVTTNLAGKVSKGTLANPVVEDIYGTKTFHSLIGGSISGLAAQATKLATVNGQAVTIAGKPFDGLSNISIAPEDITGLNVGSKQIISTAERVKINNIQFSTTPTTAIDLYALNQNVDNAVLKSDVNQSIQGEKTFTKNVTINAGYKLMGDVDGQIKQATQSLITTVGTLLSLNVAGTITSAGITSTENITATGKTVSAETFSAAGNISAVNITSTGDFIGNVTGNLTGDFTGNIKGPSDGGNIESVFVNSQWDANQNAYTKAIIKADLIGAVTGGITGDVAGNSTGCTGNSATATQLLASKKIGNVDFDGTQDIVPSTIAIVTDVAAAERFVTFNDSNANAAQQIKNHADFKYKPSEGKLTVPTIVSSLIGNITGNVNGNVLKAADNSVVINADTKIATLNGITMGGDITMGANDITGTNGSTITMTTLNGTLGTAAQTSITSVGTLSSLNVGGDLIVTSGNLEIQGATAVLTCSSLVGEVTGNASSATELKDMRTIAGQNFNGTQSITKEQLATGGIITVDGTQTLTNKTLDSTTLNGTLTVGSNDITGTSGSVITMTTLNGTLGTASQPNITSVGTLAGLMVSGNINMNDQQISNCEKLSLKAGSSIDGTSITFKGNAYTVTNGVYTGPSANNNVSSNSIGIPTTFTSTLAVSGAVTISSTLTMGTNNIDCTGLIGGTTATFVGSFNGNAATVTNGLYNSSPSAQEVNSDMNFNKKCVFSHGNNQFTNGLTIAGGLVVDSIDISGKITAGAGGGFKGNYYDSSNATIIDNTSGSVVFTGALTGTASFATALVTTVKIGSPNIGTLSTSNSVGATVDFTGQADVTLTPQHCGISTAGLTTGDTTMISGDERIKYDGYEASINANTLGISNIVGTGNSITGALDNISEINQFLTGSNEVGSTIGGTLGAEFLKYLKLGTSGATAASSTIYDNITFHKNIEAPSGLTGIASQATRLETARKIGSNFAGTINQDYVEFNGTANVTLTPRLVGLGNADDTSDVNKPVSTAVQAELDLKAPLAAPTFTGTPAAPTATPGTNTTQLATTAFVKTAVDNLVDSAPGALDTLNELAAAIGDDANYAATVTTALSGKHPSITTSARLDANLIGANGDVSNTEYGYLDGVTSAIQTQIDSKQATITDASLTIARTSGLQTALDSKQATITSSVDVSMNNLWVQGDISCNGGIEFKGHILPLAHETYDIGAADRKIRHLFLSDNSLWIGDNHKIDITGGKMKFKKRKTDIVPASILAAGGDSVGALAFTPGVGQLQDMQLHHWEEYARTLDVGGKGVGNALLQDIFVGNTVGDWEEDDALDDDIIISKVTGLQEALNGKQSTIADGDLTIAKTNGLQAALDSKQTTITLSSDISMNNLWVDGDISCNAILKVDDIIENTSGHGVEIESVLLKDQNVTAHTVTAQNYAVGSVNFISASRQGNFRDLEVKDSGNSATILLTGDGGNISIDGTLSADTIGEQTSGSGVTIDSVLLKDQNVTAHTVSASNYAVGGTNFISASRQGNFRDLEVKDSGNSATILLTGDGGNISIDGTLSADTIGEKTSTSGVTIDGVLLKDNDISANDISSNDLYVDTINERTSASGVTIDGVLLKDNNITCTDLTASGTTAVATQSAGDNTTKIASTAFVKTAIDNLIDGAPGTLDTLKELSTALDNNNSYATTITLQLAQKAPKADPTFTGTPAAPTANSGTNTTQLATTAFVHTAVSGKQDTLTSTGSGEIITATERTDYTDVSNNAVRLTGVQTVAGAKTFSSAVTVGNYTLPTAAGTQGQVLKYPASGSTLTWGSSGSGGSSIDSTTDVSMNDLWVAGDLSCNSVKLGGHIIPDTNAAYDLGNAEYKIRHLFLSDNSLWIGDDHKIDISGGKMKFKKRKKTAVPAAITSASGSNSGALTHAGLSNLSDMKLHHWEAYAHTLSGLENANIQDIFSPNTAGDWEEDEELGGSSSTTTKQGQLLETLTGICDGRTVVVESGSYTFPNVTTKQEISSQTTYEDLTGSNISYKPPSGTKQIIYKMLCQIARGDGGSGNYAGMAYRLYIDGVQCGQTKHCNNINYQDGYIEFEYVIDIGTNDMTNGKISSWTTNKTIKLMCIERDSSADAALHISSYNSEYGESNSEVMKPHLEIVAIGEGTVGAVSNAVTTSGDQTIAGTKTFSNAIISASYTTTQRDTLTGVAGMVIFNTTVNKHQGYNGSSWNDFY